MSISTNRTAAVVSPLQVAMQLRVRLLLELIELFLCHPVTSQRPAESEGLRNGRKPDAGNLHVRFDEREQETESCLAGLRRRSESFVTTPPEG
jgi:hypothetical protein